MLFGEQQTKGNWAVNDRKRRMCTIIDALKAAKNAGISVSFTKFRAEIGIKLGLSQPKIKEYFQELKDSGIAEVDETKDKIEFSG